MCDPATATVAATAVSVGGNLLSGLSERQAALYDAKVLEQNAALAEGAAADALQRGADVAGRIRAKAGQLRGQARVAMAAQGVELSGTSAQDVLASSAAEAERDVLYASADAAREAWGFKTQASQYREGARQARRTGKQALYGTFLGAAGQAASAYATAPTFKRSA